MGPFQQALDHSLKTYFINGLQVELVYKVEKAGFPPLRLLPAKGGIPLPPRVAARGFKAPWAENPPLPEKGTLYKNTRSGVVSCSRSSRMLMEHYLVLVGSPVQIQGRNLTGKMISGLGQGPPFDVTITNHDQHDRLFQPADGDGVFLFV